MDIAPFTEYKKQTDGSWTEQQPGTVASQIKLDDTALNKTNFSSILGGGVSSDIYCGSGTADLVVNFDKVTQGFVQTADYAQIDSANQKQIKILKSGIYTVNFYSYISDPTGNKILLAKVMRSENGGTFRNISVTTWQKCWGVIYGSISCIIALNAGDRLQFTITKESGYESSAFRLSGKDTQVALIPNLLK